jgi:integrase
LPTTANRARALLSAVLNRCADDHLGLAGNPCRKVEALPETSRERRLTASELKAFWRTLRAMDEEPGADRIGLAAIQFVRLTGMRRGEVLACQWEWLSPGDVILALPGDSHKTGRRAGARAAGRTACAGGPRASARVPGPAGGQRRSNLNRAWAILRKRIGADGLHLHDLRREWVSQGVAAGLTLVVLGRVVGHTSQFMTEKYLTLEDADGAAAADRVASRIVGYDEERPPAAVVPLRG